MNLEIDNQTIVSDITDSIDNNTILSNEIQQKFDDINRHFEQKLNETSMDNLKEKCKSIGISGISKYKKTDLIRLLLAEFLNLYSFLKDKKKNDLKIICTTFNIKCNVGIKKDDLVLFILQHCANNLILKLDEPCISKQVISIKNDESQPIKLSLIEELEQQKREIELKMIEETLKQQKIQEEAEKAEKIKLEEEQKRLDEEKKKEKEEAKKKKQSIPKNVRNIIWNHYIGEDIIKHKCLCCKKVTITNTNFDVGHVLSEKNGGTHEINNLRPICFACNHSMGTENMIDFVVKYGLYIG
jgi:hypothetical protein